MAKTIQTHLTDNEPERWTVEDARRVFRKGMDLAELCLAAGYEQQGQMLKGQRYAIDDVENDRIAAEIAALQETLKG